MKPILCNTQVVQNILAGRQTQDRRPMKVQPEFHNPTSHADSDYWGWSWRNGKDWFSGVTAKQLVGGSGLAHESRAKHKPGDILWLRERARLIEASLQVDGWFGIFQYEADGARTNFIRIPDRIKKMKVGNCCPNGCFKELARKFIKVNRVWYERIQDISWDDCKAEGISWITKPGEGKTFKSEFRRLWDSIYPGSWDENIWTEAIEFEMCDKPIQEQL